MNVLFGIQYQAADFFIVPPGSSPFSRTTQSDPCLAAFSAAGNPAAPAPTTTTSCVASDDTCPASTTLRPCLTSVPPSRGCSLPVRVLQQHVDVIRVDQIRHRPAV